eukprot:TRINITY_DN112776_c0_g1_i1.p1 TRINITY_DN112776_c0_g1~~TRINITY_DN112776_c0_g1_i1.p1  ORF type:complete len:235 (+),score=54.86 TRINITY_DN112776_c0_g1_i1:51-707(+)
MGSSASSVEGGASDGLVLRLGSSIQDMLRPTPEQIRQAWERHDEQNVGRLPRAAVLAVLVGLLELQLEAAKQTAHKAKTDVARQQARLERVSRQQRAELVSFAASPEGKEKLDTCTALSLGCAAGPVTAGMMSGYVDVPITCLTALRKDEELLQLRVDHLFKQYGGGSGETLRLQDFEAGYLSFFDRAASLLNEAGMAVPAGEDVRGGSTSSLPCCIQ